jgi:hypothetical protein
MAAKLNYTFAADALAAKAGVPPALLSALINAESAWNPSAVSSTGATGLGQFTKGTGTDYGLVGAGFDNRGDPALNMTAMVKYLADLRKTNPTWQAVVGHYSGQGAELAGYARYSAGQALIATIAMLDGVTPPTMPGDGPTIIVESITGHDQTTGRPARFIASMGAAATLMLISGGIVTCCSPSDAPYQQIAAKIPPEPARARESVPPSLRDLVTFKLVPGPLGPLAAPLGK